MLDIVANSIDSSDIGRGLPLQLPCLEVSFMSCLQSKQGLRGNGMSNEHYPASSYRGYGVLCTSYSLRPKSRLAMQVFVNFSSRGCFYSENYARQSSQVDQSFHGLLSCRVHSSFPEQGVSRYFLTLCRGGHLYP
jgi:hypothetical protein